MEYSFALILIFISPSWVLSQVTLVESGPGTAKPGESIRMSCKVTGNSISTGYWWHWIRQPPSKGLESLAAIRYDGATYYAPSLRSRISISKDNGRNEFYLQAVHLLTNMEYSFALILIFISPSWVLSQVTLVESGPGTAKPGESIRLSCKVTGYSISSGYYWHWIRQPPGKGLEWVAAIHSGGSTYYAPSLRSRISISKDDGKNEFYLQMSSLTVADSATYYCARGTVRELN
ncbi:UNVERIFIED_CONTAM: hypothetical protein K2H54_043794 [Gekko kuhli]